MGYQTCCVSCGAILRPVLNLGYHPHSDYFPKNIKTEIINHPLSLARCTSCGLYQIDYHLSSEKMFNNDYIYDSSINKSGRDHWNKFSDDLTQRIQGFKKKKSELRMLDVGSNSGELVSSFTLKKWDAVGIEPSENPHEIALSKGRKSINMFFSHEILSELKYEKYDLITFTNSFPHIPNPIETLILASNIIDKDIGIICIESPSADEMIKKGLYDQIYHQHMTYLDPMSMNSMCKNVSLKLFDFTETSYHNGSIRYFISHEDSKYQRSNYLQDFISSKTNHEFMSTRKEDKFRKLSLKSRQDLRTYVQECNSLGKRIACVTAPAKGNTILNFCGLSSSDLPFTTEANQLKVGRFTPCSGIPIYSDDYLKEAKPEILLVLAWNFMDVISSTVRRYAPDACFINPMKIDIE